MAMPEPTKLPAMEQTAVVRAIAQMTLPASRKLTIEAKLLAQLKTFALPLAVFRSSLQRLQNAMMANVPVPGPTRPS